MKTVPPPTRSEEPDPGSYSWKLLLIKDARVHYVVLKQQPQTTHPTHTNAHDRCSQETRNTQVPEPSLTEENQPCCLRTQQCAKHYPPATTQPLSRTPTFPKERKSVRTHKPVRATRHLFVDSPPMSTRRRTCVCATGCTPDKPPPPHTRQTVICRCSLERR